jgi:hypothetical protein
MSKSSIISFKKRTNQLTEVVFKFNREIIDVIKTIPDFMYENKKWFIHTEKKNVLQEKIELLQFMKDEDEKKTEKRIVKRKLDFDETDQTRKISKAFHSINVRYSTSNEIIILLPVSKFVFAKLMNCADLVIFKDGKNAIWKIIGIDNVKKFNECCVTNNIHITGKIESFDQESCGSTQKEDKSDAIDTDIIFLNKFPAQSDIKTEVQVADEIEDSQSLIF